MNGISLFLDVHNEKLKLKKQNKKKQSVSVGWWVGRPTIGPVTNGPVHHSPPDGD
jgi:hypothetical protein